MKRLLPVLLVGTALAALALATAAARADSINLTVSVDGTAVGGASSPDGTLNVNDQAFGIFNLNTLSINSQEFLSAPDVLKTNTLDVDQSVTGTHTLVLDIVASGLTGSAALTNFLSSFSVSGQTAGWSVVEKTLINGTLLATTPVFSGVSDSASSVNAALMTNPFTAEAVYTISTTGIGSFNGGVDIAVAAVPEPTTWLMLLCGFVGLAFAFRSRRRTTSFA